MRVFMDLQSSQLFSEPEGSSSWVQVLPLGQWRHPEYGPITIGPVDLQQFQAAYEANAYGVDLAIDFAHEEERGAAGWIKALETRPEGLFAQVEWTPKGKQSLVDREYRYFSPDWVENWTDTSGTPWSKVLRGGALTVRPFFKELEEVRLASEGVVFTFATPRWTARKVDLPLAEDRARAWDGDAAEGGLRAWAGGEEIDWAKYRQGFLAYDAANAETFGAYKLPVAEVIDGGPRVNFRAVAAVLAVLHGGRGGVNLPADVAAKVEAEAQRLQAQWPQEEKGKTMGDENKDTPVQGTEVPGSDTPHVQGDDSAPRTIQLTEPEYQRLLGVAQDHERRTLADVVAGFQFAEGTRAKIIAPASRTALVEALAEVPQQYREKLVGALKQLQLYEPGESGVGQGGDDKPTITPEQRLVNAQLGLDEETFKKFQE